MLNKLLKKNCYDKINLSCRELSTIRGGMNV